MSTLCFQSQHLTQNTNTLDLKQHMRTRFNHATLILQKTRLLITEVNSVLSGVNKKPIPSLFNPCHITDLQLSFLPLPQHKFHNFLNFRLRSPTNSETFGITAVITLHSIFKVRCCSPILSQFLFITILPIHQPFSFPDLLRPPSFILSLTTQPSEWSSFRSHLTATVINKPLIEISQCCHYTTSDPLTATPHHLVLNFSNQFLASKGTQRNLTCLWFR